MARRLMAAFGADLPLVAGAANAKDCLFEPFLLRAGFVTGLASSRRPSHRLAQQSATSPAWEGRNIPLAPGSALDLIATTEAYRWEAARLG